jgi:hypothetical protein
MKHAIAHRRQAAALCHYIDDSGTHEDSERVVMGGPVFMRKHFFEFHYEWDRMLQRHGIMGPLHMLEFNQYGKFGHLGTDERRALFQDAVDLINQRKVYSLTVEVDNLDFQKFFPAKKYRGLLGPAPLAFFMSMVLDSIVSRDHNNSGKMAYVVAKSHNNSEIVDAHTFILSYTERRSDLRVGSLRFDTPQSICALQAADLVAWANRNKALNRSFVSGFEPLERLTRTVDSEVRPPMIHLHHTFNPKSVESLAPILGEPVRQKGRRRPLLQPLPPLEEFQ